MDLEQAAINKRRNSGALPPPTTSGFQPGAVIQAAVRAPYNPFANTLETREAELQTQSQMKRQDSPDAEGGDARPKHGPGRPALDVDAFKNILMTGSATPSPPTGQAQQLRRPQDSSSSSTDTSSVSKHSMFDRGHEPHPESPRTSFDDHYSAYATFSHSDDDDSEDEKSSLMGPVISRPVEEGPPLPPKSGRVPQTVSFADFEDSIPSNFTLPSRTSPLNTQLRSNAGPSTPRSPSDLNKPLPPRPEGSSNLNAESEQDQITSPPPETANSITKKSPPPPPASRRQGQIVTNRGGRERSESNISQGSSSYPDSYVVDATSGELPKAAPRPPPSRRTQPTSSMSSSGVETPPIAATPDSAPVNARIMPPPPPPRNPSSSKTSTTSITRTPSNASRSSLQRSDFNPALPASNTTPPPAPPPRRGGPKRNSTDGSSKLFSSRRVSGAEFRRSSGQSFDSDRSILTTNLEQVVEPMSEDEHPTASGPAASDHDILADMTAFQEEIDALRAKALRDK